VCATIALPGLGQYISGHRGRGVKWLVVALAVTSATLASYALPPLVPALIVLLPVSLLLGLASWIDAYRCGRLSTSQPLRSPVWRYVAGIVLLAAGVTVAPQSLLISAARAHLAQAFSTSSAAMSPTLRPGDRFICHKRVALARWDIVVFQPPAWPDRKYVFRIAGMPGETIEIRDGQVHVNGVAQASPPGLSPYLSDLAPILQAGPGSTGKPMTLGADEYYLLGDNTRGAADSRTFTKSYDDRQLGAVPRDRIVGRATYIYWPPPRWRKL
jgi:signal peptidase I